ncbi:MAG: hypothetical protein HOM11_04420 [Methylococcales bacterium]|jgi:methionyl-tRNA formyltransferase|nr:hypothetical protein [Methylococcales bacterium]MBT7444813.1 hypothetical protein [Methylococcales bacterium]
MKVAYFGCDLFMGCLAVFAANKHDVVTIFTAGCQSNNEKLRLYADQKSINCIHEKPTKQHIEALEKSGVECMFSVEYPYLIPSPSEKVMTLNMHPTMLPNGRGATPLSWLILQYREDAGVTFHKLAPQFDEGDIVFQAPLTLDDDEGFESLLVKLHYKIPHYLNTVLADLPTYYHNALKQSGGSYWPKMTLQDRLLNWKKGLDDIQQVIRAFGRFGVVCCVDGEVWDVNHVEVGRMQHLLDPGTLISNDHDICVIAVSGGIVVIFKGSITERCKLSESVLSGV